MHKNYKISLKKAANPNTSSKSYTQERIGYREKGKNFAFVVYSCQQGTCCPTVSHNGSMVRRREQIKPNLT